MREKSAIGPIFANGAVTGAFSRLFNDEMPHIKQALTRPDADGRLTFAEATDWWRNGGGQSLSVDLNKIDLSGITASDFPGGIGSTGVFNLLNPFNSGTLSDGLVYGNITLTLGPNNTVFATRGLDYYNFDIKPWSSGAVGRNIETLIGRAYAGSGTPYTIYIRGTANIRP